MHNSYIFLQKRKSPLHILYIVTLSLLTLLPQPQHADAQSFYYPFNPPKAEVRAVWVATIGGIDWPHSYARTPYSIQVQKQELCRLLDRIRDAQLNTVIIQTRVRGTTVFPSSMEPWDGCLSGIPGKSPGYDPLAFAVSECHKRGLECHAWIVSLPLGKWNSKGCADMRRKYPALVKNIKGEGYMNPEDVRTADYLARFCKDVTARYDIDGIHLDYIRYPEDWRLTVMPQQARDNITAIVRKVYVAVKNVKPWVKVSSAPLGKYSDLTRYPSNGWNAYNKVCQDAQAWLRMGIMDMLFPMTYFRNNNFTPFAIDWKENSCGRMIVPGLGIYFMDPREGNWTMSDVTREMNTTRYLGEGYCFFRAKYLIKNTRGIYDFTKNIFNTTAAVIPPMTWQNDRRPAAPSQIIVGNDMLSWSAGCASNDSPNILYNVYSSTTYPVDINDPHNLIICRLPVCHAALPAKGRYYAVTAVDRYGNESSAIQSASGNNTNEGRRIPQLFEYANGIVTCNKPSTLWSPLVIIRDMQGRVITSRTFSNNRINVSSLPDGMYEIRSLNPKDISHRLGYFQKRSR